MVRCLRVLDLFVGTLSSTRAFQKAGHEVESLDINQRFGSSIRVKITLWEFKLLPRRYYDAIWANCPREMYSIARSRGRAPRDLALADSLVRKTLESIEWFAPRAWFIENPSGRCSGIASRGPVW